MRLRLLFALFAVVTMVPGAGGLPAAEAADYRFAPGDVIDVTVTPQRTFDRTVTVQPDGKISYPIVGQLQAAGVTVEQLTEKLRDGLNRDLVDPHVTVTLKDLNKQAVQRVSLLGAVRSPGVFEVKDGTSVAEVLANAGGPLPIADLARVTITRGGEKVITVDLASTAKTGRLDRNVSVQPGDLIVVPEGAPPTVLVLGQVARPGSFEIQGEARLLDAISLAGGPTKDADLRRVTLGRAGVAGAQTLDLQPLLAEGDTANSGLNVRLQPGDTIVIAETSQKVYVLGRVARPDQYPIKEGDRVLDAVARAGGSGTDSDITKAVLVRRDEQGRPVAKPMDLKKMMSKGMMAENVLLQAGDVLFVPDKKARRAPTDILNLVWPITGLINAFR